MKTIQFRLNLWTNDLPTFPGHAQEAGVLRVEKNETHGIEGIEKHIHSLEEIPNVIRDMLTSQGITLHKQKKSVSDAERAKRLARSRNRLPGAPPGGDWKRS